MRHTEAVKIGPLRVSLPRAKEKPLRKESQRLFRKSETLGVGYRRGLAAAAEIARVIRQELIDLITRDVDRMVVVRVMADIALAPGRAATLTRFVCPFVARLGGRA